MLTRPPPKGGAIGLVRTASFPRPLCGSTQEKGDHMEDTTNQKKRYSKWGVITAIISTLPIIFVVLRGLLQKEATDVRIFLGIFWLVIPPVALLFRSFRPPLPWYQGLAT